MCVRHHWALSRAPSRAGDSHLFTDTIFHDGRVPLSGRGRVAGKIAGRTRRRIFLCPLSAVPRRFRVPGIYTGPTRESCFISTRRDDDDGNHQRVRMCREDFISLQCVSLIPQLVLARSLNRAFWFPVRSPERRISISERIAAIDLNSASMRGEFLQPEPYSSTAGFSVARVGV